MKVILAGYNVDSEVLKELKEKKHDGSDNLTPEVISAAYARISRDPNSVNELRDISRKEVDKARKSNKNIVFGMGHHSVAEHANLNYDIIGLSRLAIEALENHRLCSYTEKSQRYITLEGDFVVPIEYTSDEKEKFKSLVEQQNAFYFKVLPELIVYQKSINPELAKDPKNKNTLEGWAKEDARYALSLATEGQLGFTANARNLENIIRKFKYHALAEVNELGGLLYEEAKKIVPSLVILADEEEFIKTQGVTLDDNYLINHSEDWVKAVSDLANKYKPLKENRNDVILKYVDDVDGLIIISLIKKNLNINTSEAENIYYFLNEKEKLDFLKIGLKNLGKHDTLPREFEKGYFDFDLIQSASCYAQMKRHRMLTLLPQPYDINLGVTVPKSIQDINRDNEFKEIAHKSEDLYCSIRKNNAREVAEYCLTNAHRRNVDLKINVRELYHFSRLREDSHAQWDIRNQAHQICELAKKYAPLTTLLLGGKDKFDEIKSKLYEQNS